jgi:hypothetical protein
MHNNLHGGIRGKEAMRSEMLLQAARDHGYIKANGWLDRSQMSSDIVALMVRDTHTSLDAGIGKRKIAKEILGLENPDQGALNVLSQMLRPGGPVAKALNGNQTILCPARRIVEYVAPDGTKRRGVETCYFISADDTAIGDTAIESALRPAKRAADLADKKLSFYTQRRPSLLPVVRQKRLETAQYTQLKLGAPES